MPMPITSVSVPQPGPPIAFDVPAGATAFAGANFKITGTGDACTKADVLTVALPGDTATVQTPFGAVDGGGQTASPMICGNKINVGSLQPASQGVLFA
jgi:hypothetical protein